MNYKKLVGMSSHPKTKPSYEAWMNWLQSQQDWRYGQNFMAPWEGPTGSSDHLYGMPRLYTEDMLGIAPKDI